MNIMNAGQSTAGLLKLRKEDLEKMTIDQLMEVCQLSLDATNQSILTIQKMTKSLQEVLERIKSLEAKILALGGTL